MINVENLTEQEKLKLASCVNPDSDQNSQFDFGPEIEQTIVASMLADRSFLTQAKALVSPKYFANQAREVICDTLFDYFDKYTVVPPKNVMQLQLRERAKAKNRPELPYLAELNTLYTCYEPELQIREWLLDKIEEFAKVQALKLAYSKTVDIVFSDKHDKWNVIWDILKQPFQISRNKDYGLDYFRSIEDWFARQKEKKQRKEIFTTGFDIIDATMGDGGPVRGELYGWMGMPGTGKSLLLVQTALANVKLGKKVLFVSLEMDADKVAKRFHSQLAQVDIHEILQHENKVVNTVKDALGDIKFNYKVEDDRLLVIKQFPPGTLDVNGLRAFLATLANDNFKPDMIVVDYVGEMKDFEGMEAWQSRQRLCRDLRALGVELDHVTWTAIQPNRSGRQAQKGGGVLNDENIGDSFGQVRVFDGLWAINQDLPEKETGVARISNFKLRDGKSHTSFCVAVSKETLAIDVISNDEYKHRMSKFKELKMAETAMDGHVFHPNPVEE